MKKSIAFTALALATTLVVADVAFAAEIGYGGDTTTVTPTTSGGGGGGGGRSGLRTATVQSSARSGSVLGASSFQFTTPLSLGSRGDAVKELQERLRAEGFFTFPTSTGYFGPITQAAVKAYQKAHNLPETGYVGPLTIAELNK